jgi:uncharacterized protein YaaW (UPF0174 family)
LNDSDRRLCALLSRVQTQAPDRLASVFARHGKAPEDGVAELAREIRLDGSNTLASVLRGWQGISYDAMVLDVAHKLKLEADLQRGEVPVERAVLEAVLGRFFDTVSPDQTEDMLKAVGETQLGRPLREGRWVPGSLEVMVRDVGAPEVALLLQQIALRSLGYGLARETVKRVAGTAGLAIPLLNVAMIGWTVVDLAGPAFRKTVPTVIEVSILRLEFAEPGSH